MTTYRYYSKDGKFVPNSLLKVSLHTWDADDFYHLKVCVMPLLTMPDFEVEVNDDTYEITWRYSEENEVQVCDAIVAKVGEDIDVPVVCMKHDENHPEFGGLQYCILCEGDGVWRDIQGAVRYSAQAIWRVSPAPALSLTVYDALRYPVRCAKVLLKEIRKGTIEYSEFAEQSAISALLVYNYGEDGVPQSSVEKAAAIMRWLDID
jgi:hypothetical protein